VPQTIISQLSKEIIVTMDTIAIRDGMLKQGFEPVGNKPDEFSKLIHEELIRWEKVVKDAGIKPE
jgi:tripartite-type tricarboxylate transporter receptor subunit TctC